MIRPVERQYTCEIVDECEHTTARLNFHNGFECEHIGTAPAKDKRRGRHRLDSRYHGVVFLPGLVVSKVESLLYRVVLSLFWKFSEPSQIRATYCGRASAEHVHQTTVTRRHHCQQRNVRSQHLSLGDAQALTEVVSAIWYSVKAWLRVYRSYKTWNGYSTPIS